MICNQCGKKLDDYDRAKNSGYCVNPPCPNYGLIQIDGNYMAEGHRQRPRKESK